MDEKYVSKYETGRAVDQALDYGVQAKHEIEVAKGSTHESLDSVIDDLQEQINQIVRAPESGGDVGAEVAQARVGADSTVYSTLKDRLDNETASIKTDINKQSDEITTLKTETAYRSKTEVYPLKPIEDTYITPTGEEHAGTGSGNNFCTDFIKVGLDEHIIISKSAWYKIAIYDADKTYVRSIGSDAEMIKAKRYSLSLNTGEAYIRLSFWYEEGYSDELFRQIKVFHYRNDNEILQYSKNIANQLEWDYLIPVDDSSTGGYKLAYSNNTVSIHDFIVFDKPVIISSKNNYKYGLVMYDDEISKYYLSIWFNKNDRAYIPAGFKLYIAVRNSNLADRIEMLSDMSEAIGIEYADNILDGLSTQPIENGYRFYGLVNGTRRNVDFKRAETDIKIHVLLDEFVYTLIQCFDDAIDYTSDNWSVLYSKSYDYIIKKGTWYSISAGYADSRYIPEYAIEDIIEFTPLIDFSSLINQIDGLQERFGALSKRIAKLENREVPSYYEDHITSKIDTLNDLREDSTKQIIFITDTHINGYKSRGGNKMNSKALMTRICEKTGIYRVVDGGDLFNAGYGLSYADTMEMIRQGVDYSQPDTSCEHYALMGNHDTGYDYPDGQTTPGNIDSFDYAIASATYALDIKVTRDSKNPTNYYFDDPKQEMRYILSNGCLREFTEETYVDTWKFLANALSSTPDGYSIVIFQHIIVGNGSDNIHQFVYDENDLINAYNTRSTATYSSAKANFTNAVGNVICMIGGHKHKDMSFTPQEDNLAVPLILTTTDNMGAEEGGLTRTAGTYTEQAFDVFTFDTTNKTIYATRIGAGEDRTFTYD